MTETVDPARAKPVMSRKAKWLYAIGRVRAATRRRRGPKVAIIEAADGVGGTWRRSTYPGAACDIQSYLYSFSFAPNAS